jgi:hypothetical protein
VKHSSAQRWLARGWFTALLFTALFARALVPVGFMPGAGGIVLCSGYAPVPDMSRMAMPGMDMSGNTDQGAGGPAQPHGMEFCPYTAVAAVMAAGHAAPLTVSTPLVPSAILFPPEQSIARGTIVPTALPRGPPSSV